MTDQQSRGRLASERVVVQSPTSFVGSALRIWKLTHVGPDWVKLVTVPIALVLIGCAWTLCAVWILTFGLLVVPWRLVRRSGRKRKVETLRHQEMLATIAQTQKGDRR